MSDRMFGMNKWMKVLAYTVLGLYTVVVAYPILFMFFTSFKSEKFAVLICTYIFSFTY